MEGAKALQIVKIRNGQLELDENLLVGVLNEPEIKESKVVVVSLAGTSHEGNHFLLGLFLRYLYAQVCKYNLFRGKTIVNEY